MGGTQYDDKLWRRVVLFSVVLVLAAACVRPAEPTPIPTATLPPGAVPPPTLTPVVPTATPNANPLFPPVNITTWIQANLPPTDIANMTLFTQFQVESDEIVGFTFNNENTQLCVGFVLVTLTPPQVWNGSYSCLATDETTAAYQSLPFALTNGSFYVAFYGYIDRTAFPATNAVSVIFTDGGGANQLIEEDSGFVLPHGGLNTGLEAVLIESNGNTITRIPVQQ